MALTVNEGGVLRTLGSVSVNDGGVIRNLGSVSANDGGVIRKIHSSSVGFGISGITPLVVADDHVVITASGSGTISLPVGARIILGSAGYETRGGCVAEYTLTSAVKNASFTATVNTENKGGYSDWEKKMWNATKIVIDNKSYGCGYTRQVIQSKWGPIGGDGGAGEFRDYAYTDSEDDDSTYAEDGTGAGGGGAGYTTSGGTKGGNNGGYGNFGGNGGRSSRYPATDGASGKGYSGSSSGGGGGGGGYAAGGGGAYSYEDEDGSHSLNNEGEAGSGIIVIEW